MVTNIGHLRTQVVAQIKAMATVHHKQVLATAIPPPPAPQMVEPYTIELFMTIYVMMIPHIVGVELMWTGSEVTLPDMDGQVDSIISFILFREKAIYQNCTMAALEDAMDEACADAEGQDGKRAE